MIKVDRSYPAPESLGREKKVNGSYSNPDVVKQLETDFDNKCYLCEIKPVQDPEIEHLKPHYRGKDIDRKFDWDNLFWSCGHCNSIKNQRKYDEDIIDCCKMDPEEEVEIIWTEENVICNPRKPNEQAKKTAELMTEIFNKKNTEMRVIKSQVRFDALTEEMNSLLKCLEKYTHNPLNRCNNRKLKAILRRKSAFASFKRDYIRRNVGTYKGIELYIE